MHHPVIGMVYIWISQGPQHGLNYQNVIAVQWHYIHFNNTKKRFIARKYIPSGESKQNVKRGGHEIDKLRHLAHLFIGRGEMVI